MKDKAVIIIGAIIIIGVVVFFFFNSNKGGEKRVATLESGVTATFDENANVRVEDPSIAKAELKFDHSLNKYVIRITAKTKEGMTLMYFTDVHGRERVYDIEVEENSIGFSNTPEFKKNGGF